MRVFKRVVLAGLLVSISAAAYAALIGIAANLGYPRIDFSGPTVGGTTFNAATRELSVTAAPVSAVFTAGGASRPVTPPEGLALRILVPDNAGTTVASIAGDDFVLSGEIDADGNGSPDYTGVLLTGEILTFGSLNTASATDAMDFRFRVTGGSLASQYNARDIGVLLTMEGSNFNGSFAQNFSAGSKGFVGPVPCAGRVGDIVWHDLNRDGLQDPGEPGINNVLVTLTGTDGFGNPVSLSTTTAPGPMGQQGYYQFTGLCNGEYVVTATTPDGFSPTDSLVGGDRGIDSNGSPTTVTLTGLSDQTLDFGYVTECTGAIGDFVWHDLNRNGLQDPDEPGIDNVTVTLTDPVTGTVLATTTTGPNGFYKFNGLCAGDYKVTVNESDLPAGYTPTATLVPPDTTIDSNPNPFVVTLPADDTEDMTIDFGYVTPCTGLIGDYVWYDKNQNGLQDPTEMGIAGVTLKLLDSNGAVITTTTTGANGYYQFTGLCANTYKVVVDATTVPSGFSPTEIEVGGDRTVDSNPSPTTVVLTTDFTEDLTIDFGYIAPCTGQIGDFVWHDKNQNGIQDAGEPGIKNVTVNLKGADNTILQTDITDKYGRYLFKGLCPGTYKVEVIPPPGAQASPTEQGGNTAVDSNPNPTVVTLDFDDTSDLTNDFGFYYPKASLGDFVWHDLNRDGIQDPDEPGIDGVLVLLYTCGSILPIDLTLTSDGGAYLFDNLNAGCYEVLFVTPLGYERTLANAGVDDSEDSDASTGTGRTGPYTLAWGEFNPTIDAGYYKPAKLGDFVWHDKNSNGIQDSGETQGVVGAIATLYVCGDTNSPLASQTVGATGYYLFTNLVPGSYYVKFTLPAGHTFTDQNAGSNDARDSDASPTTGRTQCVTLQSGDANLTLDAGVVLMTPACVPTTVQLTGGTNTKDTYGNIREFSYNGVKVRASAFSRSKTSNSWETAYLGSYSYGLGVLDRSESSSGDQHTVDNNGRNNYILFEFSSTVVVTQAFLDYVGSDSDIQVWVLTANNPYSNHLSLNDAVLAGASLIDSSNTSNGNSRWAAFNGGEIPGNAVIIAARPDQKDDSFKLRKLEICVPKAAKAAIGDFVWHDQNKNGIQDAGEAGIDGATVRLLDASNNVIATKVTGDDPHTSGTQKGYYEFTNLTPGVTYRVQFVTPGGYDQASPRKAGSDRAKDSDGAVSDPIVLAPGEFNRTIDAGFYKAQQVCVPTTLSFTGKTATSGTKGNIRTYTFGSLSVKVSAFSRTKSYSGSWSPAYLGAYSAGLGVTDTGEGNGSGDKHVVDNIDRNNYVLFEFSSPVVVDQAYLDYVRGDSDISVWIGTNPAGSNPYTHHLSLSDAVLNAFSVKESNTTTSKSARWANINAGGRTGNALVIATPLDDSNDGFKLHKLLVCK